MSLLNIICSDSYHLFPWMHILFKSITESTHQGQRINLNFSWSNFPWLQILEREWVWEISISKWICLFFFFGCVCGMWKFLGQELNLSHGSNPNHCSDNTRSLTLCATKITLGSLFHMHHITYYTQRFRVKTKNIIIPASQTLYLYKNIDVCISSLVKLYWEFWINSLSK